MSEASPRRPKRIPLKSGRRRGAVTLLVLFGLGILLGLVALAVNLTWLSCHQVRLRQACQSAALAGAVELMDPAPLDTPAAAGSVAVATSPATDPATAARIVLAQRQAMAFAARNGVILPINPNNAAASDAGQDVIAGWVDDPSSPGSALKPWTGTEPVNTLFVRAVRRRSRGDAVTLWFGSLFGTVDAEPAAAARASVDQRVYGFRPAGHVRVPLVPLLAFSSIRWPCSISGAEPGAEDRYSVDPRTGGVRQDSDGIGEITLRIRCAAGASATGLEEGEENACWLSLAGATADSTLLTQQVAEGLAPSDLAALGGGFTLGADGGLLLAAAPAADCGQLVALRQVLLTIRGQKRIWPLGTFVASGEQRLCRVEGFAAGCVADCILETESCLAIVVQPCLLETCTAQVSTSRARNPWIGKLILSE